MSQGTLKEHLSPEGSPKKRQGTPENHIFREFTLIFRGSPTVYPIYSSLHPYVTLGTSKVHYMNIHRTDVSHEVDPGGARG
jgi:hypothetical protein